MSSSPPVFRHLEESCWCLKAVEAIGNCILACCGHPFLKLGFLLGFMMYLYYFFLISCGKLSGVYDEEVAGKEQ